MSSRASRVRGVVHPFPWRPHPCAPNALPSASESAAVGPLRPDPDQLAAAEQEAYRRGYAEGENAATAAARASLEPRLARLADTIEEIAGLRPCIVRATEQQLVELALAIARRVVRREVTLDREITIALARVAVERLGARHGVTIRLNPDDVAYAATRHGDGWPGGGITVIADATIEGGGCRVESPVGTIDAGVDVQLDELARGLLSGGAVSGQRERP